MKTINSASIDWIKKFIDELTVTDVTPEGCRVQSIVCENSHRGKIYSPLHRDWTNVVIKFHTEDTRDLMNRKQLTMPVPDLLIDMCNMSVVMPDGQEIIHKMKCYISGSLHKAGFFEASQARPEKDKY